MLRSNQLSYITEGRNYNGTSVSIIPVSKPVLSPSFPRRRESSAPYRCSNTALRLATKAAMPSFWSAVANKA